MVMGNYLTSIPEEEVEEIISCSNNLQDGASYIDAYFDAQCGVRASTGVVCFTTKYDNLLILEYVLSLIQVQIILMENLKMIITRILVF